MPCSNASPPLSQKDGDEHPDEGSESGFDSESGSGTQTGSPSMKTDKETISNPHSSPRTTGGKVQFILLTISFTLSGLLLFVTVSIASQNNSMLSALQPYAVDLANVTNKTWGYGSMPMEILASDRAGRHPHGAESKTATALDPEDTSILYSNMWLGDEPGVSVFPTTSDTLDEERPDEVVTYEMNFLVKKHVSTVIQYNRRISSNESYRTSHTTCALQAYMPPFQSLENNKTLVT